MSLKIEIFPKGFNDAISKAVSELNIKEFLNIPDTPEAKEFMLEENLKFLLEMELKETTLSFCCKYATKP